MWWALGIAWASGQQPVHLPVSLFCSLHRGCRGQWLLSEALEERGDEEEVEVEGTSTPTRSTVVEIIVQAVGESWLWEYEKAPQKCD